MILYVNGCSHTAAAEAVVPYAFAEDDYLLPNFKALGRKPHPKNLADSWCTHLSKHIGSELVCDAESAASNDRIIRTTKSYFDNFSFSNDIFVILQWSTWEREEWFYDGTWFQVNASGIDIVPDALKEKYKNYVLNIDYNQKTLAAHNSIWNMHLWLKERNLKHFFYSSWSTFSDINQNMRFDWGKNYLYPYDRNYSYANILKNNSFTHSKGYHFGADGHRFWAQYLLQYIQANNLI